MAQDNSAVSVFTARGIDRILSEGGSQAWVLDAQRAASCGYLVCVQNRGFADDWGQASAPHKEAFLVGRVSKVVPSTEDQAESDRSIIMISHYAEISVPEAWPGNRNPVRYTTLDEIGINVDTLDFKLMPMLEAPLKKEASSMARNSRTGLSLEEAKTGIALRFGVKPEQVLITING
ncbi:hypothetical protein CLU86_0282 [Acidovorax sp. 62]|uniref:hypothetical protein n=1 Tax=Acidovorax sp. 62 TaxID=2035203 RepID=UPI000C177A14|nr:hypothetical protein [Acidovorax sp. 62]PIF89413.1 hypothetical protein CLU86_0282 [Acidovorax sp. 62]